MKRPYIKALKRPAATDELPFMKNDTVIGTIGNTHGVSSAAKPQITASMIRAQLNGFSAGAAMSSAGSTLCASPSTAGATAAEASPTATSNSQYSGEWHAPSTQAIHITSPLTVACAAVSRRFCVSTILSK